MCQNHISSKNKDLPFQESGLKNLIFNSIPLLEMNFEVIFLFFFFFFFFFFELVSILWNAHY